MAVLCLHIHTYSVHSLPSEHSTQLRSSAGKLSVAHKLCPLTQQHMDVHVAQLSLGCVPVISEITSAEPKGWKCCQGLAVRGPLEVFKLTLSQVGTALSVTSNRRQWVLQHGCAFVSVPGPAGCRQAERCSSRWAVKLSCTLFAYEE